MCADSLLVLFHNNGPTQKDLFGQENSQELLWFHKKCIAALDSHCPPKSASCHEIAPLQRPFFDLFYWTSYPFSFRGNLLCFAAHLRFFGPTIQFAFHSLPIVLATRTKRHVHEVVPARTLHNSPLQRLSSHYQRGPQDHSEGHFANQDWHVQPLCPAHVGVPDHQRKRRPGRSTGHGGRTQQDCSSLLEPRRDLQTHHGGRRRHAGTRQDLSDGPISQYSDSQWKIGARNLAGNLSQRAS